MAQTEWVKENRDKENIVFVTHVGDVVNDHKQAPDEWVVAQRAMSVLDGVVPWGVAIGNHDFDSLTCRPAKATPFSSTSAHSGSAATRGLAAPRVMA